MLAACCPALAVFEGDCYAWGSGGWDLIYWGSPDVRLPKGGVIKICAAQSTAPPGSVVFRWREQEGPQGVCRILGDTPQQCPAVFNESTCETLIEVLDSNPSGTLWPTADAPAEPGTYWLTSPVPGACENGVKIQVQVVAERGSGSGSSSSSADGSEGSTAATSGAARAQQRSCPALLAALAASLAVALLPSI
ncbi:AT-rich interactive domain-containing [Chlorella sorokiniana]|uniref:AT-rich interactive domain-containing n=1 Tax=Chlorella sorokiniana TaxID=3076 RepID=A0A2P6TMF4_CHLSO|nr:AT-rich interactive domain-containing [Chlorella sorokiniana]|eukprot:PRW45522.1 AT-rich interactive domain-containing [Chlorella sorokiniana]